MKIEKTFRTLELMALWTSYLSPALLFQTSRMPYKVHTGWTNNVVCSIFLLTSDTTAPGKRSKVLFHVFVFQSHLHLNKV